MSGRRESGNVMAEGRASSMRQQAMAMAAKRKQEYLGARVPKALREKMLMQAENLGIPVSILIRNILTEYVDNLGDVAQINENRPLKERDSVVAEQQKRFDEVIGWERLQLNKEVICTGCSNQLSKGDEVVFGLVPGKNHVILCKHCKQLEGLD